MSYISATAEIMYAPLDFRFAVIAFAQSLPRLSAIGTGKVFLAADCILPDATCHPAHLRRRSKFVEQSPPRVLIIQLGNLPHDLFATRIVQLRHTRVHRSDL